MNKTCFCGISEHCGYQIETDMEQHDKVIYEQGYNNAIDSAIKLVGLLIEELDVEECTKYGNKDAKQQMKSYDTLMKYEIAGSIDDLLDRLEQLKSKTDF